MNDKVVLNFGTCYACKARVRVGVMRCPEGHWLWWIKKGDKWVSEDRRTQVIWPQSGTIHFRDQAVLNTLDTPITGQPVRPLRPAEKVKVVAMQGDFYQLEGGGWVHHRHVVLWHPINNREKPKSAKVIRKGGATVWTGADKKTRVKLVPESAEGTVYEIVGIWARVSETEDWWMNISTLEIRR